ncbi:hypothetical protein GE09DRAFT_1224853 [Coniochaeta sp. 2T2.1]|nr:hypothetical protein GE09DRAFT_1224853 [Coniochaeta sp. 2T2.1]
MPYVTHSLPEGETQTSPNVPLPPTIWVFQNTSPFTPKHWICPSCTARVPYSPLSSQTCPTPSCQTPFTWSTCTLFDQRDRALDAARFPVHWNCSTCFRAHLAAEVLLRDVTCRCDKPALQAVWDQFGDLFLWWEKDEEIYDLTDGKKVEEAARRLWEAGGARWADEMPLVPIRMQEEGEKVGERMIGSSTLAVMVEMTA